MKSVTILLSVAMAVLWPWNGRAQENSGRQRIRVINRSGAKPARNEAVTEPSGAARDTVQLQFGPSSDVKDVLHFYEMLTGQHVIYTDQVAGPCPLVVFERISKEEALKLIEKALFANGFTLIDSSDKGTIHVTGIGESPTQFPVPVYTKPEDLPEGRERVVKMVFKIQHRDVIELAQRMTTAYPSAPYMQGQAYLADTKSKTLVVTERTSTVREIAKLVEQLDVFDRERLIRISLVVVGGAALLLLALMPFVGRRAVERMEK